MNIFRRLVNFLLRRNRVTELASHVEDHDQDVGEGPADDAVIETLPDEHAGSFNVVGAGINLLKRNKL